MQCTNLELTTATFCCYSPSPELSHMIQRARICPINGLYLVFLPAYLPSAWLHADLHTHVMIQLLAPCRELDRIWGTSSGREALRQFERAVGICCRAVRKKPREWRDISNDTRACINVYFSPTRPATPVQAVPCALRSYVL